MARKMNREEWFDLFGKLYFESNDGFVIADFSKLEESWNSMNDDEKDRIIATNMLENLKT